jgi:hypothetical protein
VKNGTETDVDCGGGTCAGCAATKACTVAADCQSSVCNAGVCLAPTCNDGVQNGTETGLDCGGPCQYCPRALLVATGPFTFLAEYTAGSWVPTLTSEASSDEPGVALAADGTGLAVIRGASDALRTAQYAGSWSLFTGLGAGATTRARPSVCPLGVTFHGFDYKYYFAPWVAGAFGPVEQVGAGGVQAFGPVGPDSAQVGSEAWTAYFDGLGGANVLSVRMRTAGAWTTATTLPANEFQVSPSLASTSGGPMLAWRRSPDAQVMYATQAGGAWTAPAPITNAFTNDRVALTATATGALLAFRGLDGMLYTATWAGGAWSAPAPFSTPNVSISASPAASRGIRGDIAELAWLSGGVAYHARLTGSGWTVPTLVGGSGLTGVAITSGP